MNLLKRLSKKSKNTLEDNALLYIKSIQDTIENPKCNFEILDNIISKGSYTGGFKKKNKRYVKLLYNSKYNPKKNTVNYYFGNFKLSYTGSPKKFSKGTIFTDIKIYNVFKSESPFGSSKITTYRFGTNIYNIKNSNDLSEIFKYIKNTGGDPAKPLICISLLGNCNTNTCNTIHSSSKMIPKLKEVFDEKYMLDIERKTGDVKSILNKKTPKYMPLFLSLRPKKYLGLVLEKNIPNTPTINDVHYQNINKILNNYLDAINKSTSEKHTGELEFRAICDMSIYYAINCAETHNFAFHCKSGKDRTSIYDAVQKATFYYLDKKHSENHLEINYEVIKKYVKYFLFIGLVISFYSTFVVGLKIKHLPVAKYILSNKEIQYFSGVFA